MIKDLLWACVVCGVEGGIRRVGRTEICAACNATYRRGSGADIVVTEKGREPVVRNAKEWLDNLPRMRLTGEALADVRISAGDTVLRDGARYLGRTEHFGPSMRGTLVLTDETISFKPAVSGEPFEIKLDELTAVQPSSSALQLKARGQPVIVVKFPNSSAKLWEERLQHSLRHCYARHGLGEITEFQPRICTL